jgi:hypothetical protein
VDFSKLHSVLNFSPIWNIDQGVEQVIKAISEKKVTNYMDPRFNNASFLSSQGLKMLARLSSA